MRYRKKPVVVEAEFFSDAEQGERLARWCGGTLNKAITNPRSNFEDEPTRIAIATLEGTMYASLGDWIIKGVAGEFYPCKPAIFDATYEEAR